MQIKTCKCCDKELSIEMFYLRKATKLNGKEELVTIEHYDVNCKKCTNVMRRRKNREKARDFRQCPENRR